MKYYFTKTSFLLLAFVFMTSAVMAQFTVSGTITDGSGESLIGATILVKGTALGTVTDFDGNYSINVPGDSGQLEFSYTGYASKTMAVSSANSTVDVILDSSATELDAVVVTGLASSVKRSNLANSVASIPAAEISGISVPTTTDAALYGKFKGANITASSGAPGGGLSFRLRGLTSISGSSQPLIVLDGVYVDNSSIPAGLNVVSQASGGGSQSNQDNPSNRLADLDPNDIETIEILKGASAAAIYGSRASGGVVIISTKRGQAGKTKISLGQSIGWTEMLNPLGVREFTEERVLNSNFAANIDDFRAARDAGRLVNYEDELFGNKGTLSNTRLSISGGTEKTKFFIGTSYKNETGIVANTGYNKASVRLNLEHDITDWLDVSTSLNYVNSSADRGFFNNDNSGTTQGVSFSSTPSFAQLLPDENGVYPNNPYAPSNFLQTGALITNNEAVNRFIGGGTLTAQLYQNDQSSLKFIVRGGIDNYTLNTKAIFPNTLQFQSNGNGLNGVSVQGNTVNVNTNISAFLVQSQYLPSGLNFRTQLGVTQLDFDQNTILGQASNLIGTQTNLDQGGNRDIVQNRLIQQDKGFFLQEEINYNDMIVATVGIRGDKSSNNGDVNKLYYYPKASAAVNFHEFDFYNDESVLSQVKLRAAYGQSGNFASFGSKFTSLNSAVVNGQPGVEISSLLGNSLVGPERQSEVEFGVDLGVLNNKVRFDATYYIKTVDDLLLNAATSPSTGFTSQVTNAAALENKGLELGLNFDAIDTEDFKWFTRVNWWKNNSEVTRLDVPAFTTGGFADFLGNFMVKEGFSPTTIIGVGPNPTVTLNGDGAPSLQIYGNAEPDFQMSWFNTFNFLDNFDLTFLWHWKQGGENINLSTLLFDLNNTTYDYDDTGLDPDGALANGPYRLSVLGSSTDPFVQDAGYIRLREIGLYYTIPKALLGDVASLRLGFSGNNLVNIFDYQSYDPEVSNFGAGGLSSGVEVNPFPSSKRYNFHVIANF